MPPAFETAAARGAPDVLAIPARRIGYLMPSKVHSGVWSAGGGDMMGDQTSFGVFEKEHGREERREVRDTIQREAVAYYIV